MTEETNNKTNEELNAENALLRGELAGLRERNSLLLKTYAEAIRKTQVFSASIKAGVSSLLDADIFWDAGNQREFLTSINLSVGKVTELNTLLALGLHLETGTLSLVIEGQSTQEMLTKVKGNFQECCPGKHLTLNFPPEGPMALVDYSYFVTAIDFLLQIIANKSDADEYNLRASVDGGHWLVEIKPVSALVADQVINEVCISKAADFSAEDRIRTLIFRNLARCQNIGTEVSSEGEDKAVIRLTVPVITNF